MHPRFHASGGYRHDTVREHTGQTAPADDTARVRPGHPASGSDTGQLPHAVIPGNCRERRYSKNLLRCKPDAQSRTEFARDTLPQAAIPDDCPGRRCTSNCSRPNQTPSPGRRYRVPPLVYPCPRAVELSYSGTQSERHGMRQFRRL